MFQAKGKACPRTLGRRAHTQGPERISVWLEHRQQRNEQRE